MRIAVISDVHSNLPALEAVIAGLDGIDRWWHLGDIVGYGPHPDEVVGRLVELGAIGVRGNHDAAALGGPEIEWFNPDARRALEWTERRIDRATRDWLGALPERHVVDDMTLVHGSPRDPTWEYVTTATAARANLEAFTTSYLLHGHTHVPIAWRAEPGHLEVVGVEDGSQLELDGRRMLLNPGSVGQPRDGDPRASALVVDTEARTVTWRRIAYPISEVQADIRDAGLPKRLAERLAHGR